MLKKLEFKSSSDPLVEEYNIMALNSGLQTFSPKNNTIIQLDDIQKRRAQFLGDSYNSMNNFLKKTTTEFNYNKEFYSLNPYDDNEDDFEDKNDLESYNMESSFIDLKNKVSTDNFENGVPLEFQKCQNLNSSDTNIFNVFSNIATGRSRVCEVYEDIEENYTSEIFQGKENKNWKGVESLNLDYHSLELQKENGVSKKRL